MIGNERRAYVRDSEFILDAKVSKDQQHWECVEITDFSASGLNYSAGGEYKVGDILWFDLVVHDFRVLNEPLIKVRGKIRRVDRSESGNSYGVSFKNLSMEQQIRIDEIIQHKNKVRILAERTDL